MGGAAHAVWREPGEEVGGEACRIGGRLCRWAGPAVMTEQEARRLVEGVGGRALVRGGARRWAWRRARTGGRRREAGGRRLGN